jgi:hypothetical protein
MTRQAIFTWPYNMVRPHPAVWKVMHGLFVLYLLFLVFLLFQETNDARMVLKFISPDLVGADGDHCGQALDRR